MNAMYNLPIVVFADIFSRKYIQADRAPIVASPGTEGQSFLEAGDLCQVNGPKFVCLDG